MHCILCYQKLIIGINLKTQARKRLISYYKTNGITSLKQHVDVEHTIIAKKIEEVIFLLKRREEKKPTKKRAIVFGGIFFYQKFLQKRGCSIERIFRRPRSFDCQKKITNLICGKHVAETFNLVFVSKITFPFQKAVFTRNITKVS